MSQPVGRAHHMGNPAAHHAVQMVQQSNRAVQALILRNLRTMRYVPVPPQPEPETESEAVTPLGLELARTYVINEYEPIDGSTPIEVVIDGKQVSLGLGGHREYGLHQALMDIAEAVSDD